jgi:hypothetical protein
VASAAAGLDFQVKRTEKGYFLYPQPLHGCPGRHSSGEFSSAMLAMREVKAIYHQGLYAVAATIRQLYEMIETEDERVHRLVAAATAAHLHKIEQLTGRIARLEEELAVKARQVHRLELTARELKKELKEGLRESAVIGVDESGLRVSKRQDWGHVSSTEKLTLLIHDRRRGQPAISGIDILPRYEGVCVHDGFSSYDQ